ncbi:beta-glucosidase [Novosphingobium sp. ZW T3_23]|uniref:beta-glucosidase family protein n=1 Tax=Novosphingobium sp. ZW T3_23 TaxID=3378084 RepID=UPI0038549D59
MAKINSRAIQLLASCAVFCSGLPVTAHSREKTEQKSWMADAIVAEQGTAKTDAAKEAVALRRAKLLIAAMTTDQKMQQLTGSRPEILPELPNCFGARHARGIPELSIPTFRITNGPVGVGQNDCVSPTIVDTKAAGIFGPAMAAAYTHSSSAKATALPSAIGVAASFDPAVASNYGSIIADDMNDLALHVFEAPGLNLARLPILGRNFEYFGEDPYLTAIMATSEIKAVQAKGLIAMPKHYVANEQETNRQSVDMKVDRQVLRELYLLPFEMAVKDGKAASVMCAYNTVNGTGSCENKELLTDILRKDWSFTGYVQPDFFATKTTVPAMKAGMDHEMPQPMRWSPKNLNDALVKGDLVIADFDQALERRYTQMFKAGIFDRPLVQRPMDIEGHGRAAREIGTRSAVLLQNNGALPIRRDVGSVLVIGKASQPYAQQAVAGGALTGKPMGSGGGSSDVVPHYSVTPIEGIRNALQQQGNTRAAVKLVLIDDENRTATIDGASTSFEAVLTEAAAADAVILMAGTISEEGADRATFTVPSGKVLAGSAADGHGLDWYADRSDVIAVLNPGKDPRAALARNSQTLAMIKALLGTPSTSGTSMSGKAVLVLKDNASVAMDPALVGPAGPAILEAWFPGQEDGNIVADLLFGLKNPGGKLPVTFSYAGKGFLDNITPEQFPGVVGSDGKTQTVSYTEKLAIGYRWYDSNLSGQCEPSNGRNPCVAFPFGYGLSYTSFTESKPSLSYNARKKVWRAKVRVKNTGKSAGAQVIQVYVALPPSASEIGAPQPPKRLVGFQRILLPAGTAKTVSIAIDPAASNHPLGVWDENRKDWITPSGEHRILIGTSSSPSDLVPAGTIKL